MYKFIAGNGADTLFHPYGPAKKDTLHSKCKTQMQICIMHECSHGKCKCATVCCEYLWHIVHRKLTPNTAAHIPADTCSIY